MSMSADTTVPSTPNTMETLEAAWKAGTRGNALLLVALTVPDLPADSLVSMLATQFPEKPKGYLANDSETDPFTWVKTIEEYGLTTNEIQGLMLEVLSYTDYPNEGKFGTVQKCKEFIRYGVRYWHLVTRETFAQVIDRILANQPEFVFTHRETIAYMMAKHNGAPNYTPTPRDTRSELAKREEHFRSTVNLGMEQAMPYLRRACDKVMYISSMAEAMAVLTMPLDLRKRVVERVIQSSSMPGAVVPPVRNLATVYLAIQVFVSGGCDDELERKLLNSLAWKPTEYQKTQGSHADTWSTREPQIVTSKDDDPDRAVRLFRWYLKYLAEVPVETEAWMGRFITPEGARTRATQRLTANAKQVLQGLGYRFEHVVMGRNPNNDTQRAEVRFEHRGLTKVYVHDTDCNEGYIPNGTEVIVPSFVPGDTLFRRRHEVGWRIALHPVAPPSSATQSEAWRGHTHGKI